VFAGIRIVRAHPTAGWKATRDGPTATWRGGPLEHLAIETFRLDVDVSAPPGPVTLNTRELYPSGATVDWPATLTVIPGPDDGQSESGARGWIVAIVGVGLIFVSGLAVLARRERPRPRRSVERRARLLIEQRERPARTGLPVVAFESPTRHRSARGYRTQRGPWTASMLRGMRRDSKWSPTA